MTRKKKSKKSNFNSWLSPTVLPWLIISVLIVISGILVLPTKVGSYQVEVPYLDTETYTVDVPYEDIEEYTVSVPYETSESYVETIPTELTENVKFSEERIECTGANLFFDGVVKHKVTNLDSDATEFIVKIGISSGGVEDVALYSQTINPLDSYIFEYVHEYSSGNCISYVTNSPTKTRIEQKQVVKQKTTTQYRDETKYRKVTKTRTETREREVQKTRVEKRYKEVNWLFGFNALIRFNGNLPETEVISEG